jgi:hypothetical protein
LGSFGFHSGPGLSRWERSPGLRVRGKLSGGDQPTDRRLLHHLTPMYTPGVYMGCVSPAVMSLRAIPSRHGGTGERGNLALNECTAPQRLWGGPQVPLHNFFFHNRLSTLIPSYFFIDSAANILYPIIEYGLSLGEWVSTHSFFWDGSDYY